MLLLRDSGEMFVQRCVCENVDGCEGDCESNQTLLLVLIKIWTQVSCAKPPSSSLIFEIHGFVNQF